MDTDGGQGRRYRDTRVCPRGRMAEPARVGGATPPDSDGQPAPLGRFALVGALPLWGRPTPPGSLCRRSPAPTVTHIDVQSLTHCAGEGP